MNYKLLSLVVVLFFLFAISAPYLAFAVDCCDSEEKCCCADIEGWYLSEYECTCSGGEVTSRECNYMPDV